MSSILQALYNSVSGLFSFSRSLNTISDNISNMNTPGFRGSQSFFESMQDEHGTRIAGTGRDLSEGQIQQSGSDTDAAIDGSGLFILRDAQGRTFYTRSGQFTFDETGKLVDTVNRYFVQGFDPSGTLGGIDISDYRTLPAEATSTVKIVGNIAASPTTQSVSSIVVYDALGTAHTFSLTLTSNTATTAGSWQVAVKDENGTSVGTGEIRFSTSGTLQPGYNSVTVTPSLGGASQPIVFDFGTPGSLSGATSISGTPSNVSAQVVDGHGTIGISSEQFDAEGVLQLTYADGEKKAGPQLALASFADESQLQIADGNLYREPKSQKAEVGRPGTGSFGRIDGGSLEMSNVDLTRELADMIVVQRGYQASSRVMTVSSDMLQQLYDATRGG